MIRLGLCGRNCAITGKVSLNHPKWGPIILITALDRPSDIAASAATAAFDATGKLVWSEKLTGSGFEHALTKPSRDSTGNIFIKYNPGRYEGIEILRPTTKGFTVLAGDYDRGARFYYAELHGPGPSGTYSIKQFKNDCLPICASGTVTSQMYYWNGTDYARR